jgi:hypothetical protein
MTTSISPSVPVDNLSAIAFTASACCSAASISATFFFCSYLKVSLAAMFAVAVVTSVQPAS